MCYPMIALGLAALAYNPSPVYEVHGAGDVSANGFYVFFRRADDGNSAVFARAYEKRGPADHLSPPSELEWQRVASGAVHWTLKRQRFAPRCFRPAASYNDSCGRCCTLPGTAPVYGARTPPSATAPHEAWPAPPATGWTVALGGGSGDSEHSRSAAAGGTLLPAPSVRRLEAPNAAATALTMAPLAECLHRATVLLSRQHEAEAVALHAQCAGAAEAHYSEGLGWLAELRSFDKIFIYTKAPNATSEAALRALVPERLRAAVGVQVQVQTAGEAPPDAAADVSGGSGGCSGVRGVPGTPTVCVRRLPNVGREGHTFLHHTAAEYDGDVAAAAGTAFLQGEPQPHLRFAALDAVVRACVAAGRAEARGNATAATSS